MPALAAALHDPDKDVRQHAAIGAAALCRANQSRALMRAATEFVRGHRLTIANCFYRKLVRKDEVSALSALYAEQHGYDPGLTRIE